MKDVKGTLTESNLIEAFSLEAQTASRYDFFASRANIEGHNEAAQFFDSSSQTEREHAQGCLEFFRKDPISGNLINRTRLNIQSAILGDTQKYHDIYPQMAEVARQEGFEEIAVWFETIAKAKRIQVNQLQKILNTLLD